MADTWEEILTDAKVGDVTFPVTSRAISGGRDGARIKPPYQGGQRVEDTGRQAYAIKLKTELFADVDPSHYPALFEELLDVFTNDEEQSEIEYVDPLLGTMRVKVWSWQVDETAELRNGATVTFECEEITDDQALSYLVPPRTPGREAIAAAAELDDGLEAAGVTDAVVDESFKKSGYPKTGDEKSWPAGQTFENLADEFQAALQVGAQTVDEVAAQVDRARSRVRTMVELVELRGATGWAAYASALMLIDALSAMGDAAVARAVPIVTFTVGAEMSAVEIATRLYGDPRRADEVLRRNPSRRPHAYPRGTVLRVAQR